MTALLPFDTVLETFSSPEPTARLLTRRQKITLLSSSDAAAFSPSLGRTLVRIIGAAGCISGISVLACTGSDATPTKTPTAVLIATATPMAASPTSTVAALATATPLPTSTPVPALTSTPASQPSPTAGAISLNTDTVLLEGQTFRVQGTAIDVTLVSADVPPPTCNDCPNGVTLRVASGSSQQTLEYTLGGNMPAVDGERARRKSAFGYTFIVQRVTFTTITLRVESP